MTPTFSIIIPVYNVAPYLRECLDSVLAQTFTDWEAICVDDGSTDGSGEILDEYAAKDNRFRVIHQQNAGVSAARNAALDVATGEWVLFLDSDDRIKDNTLTWFAERISKADVTFFSMCFYYPSGYACEKMFPNTGILEMSDQSSRLLYDSIEPEVGGMFGWPWNKFFKCDIIKNNHIRFDLHRNIKEDELFTLEVMNYAESFEMVSDAFYDYTVRDTGLSKSTKTDYSTMWLLYWRFSSKMKFVGLYNIAIEQARLFSSVAMSKNVSGVTWNILKYYDSYGSLYSNCTYAKVLSLANKMPKRMGFLFLILYRAMRKICASLRAIV